MGIYLLALVYILNWRWGYRIIIIYNGGRSHGKHITISYQHQKHQSISIITGGAQKAWNI
jgi:hypothetical protein